MENLRPKIITMSTLKGGSGKTSAAFNLIGFLAQDKKKVLAIDFDAQANLSRNFGVNQIQLKYSYEHIGDVLENKKLPSFTIMKSPNENLPSVDLIPSHIYLTKTEMSLVNKTGREFILRDYLEDHADTFNRYDYIVCDTSPSLNVINQNALLISDKIILVADVDINSVLGALLMITEWNAICKTFRIENKISGLLVNKIKENTKIAKDFLMYINKHAILKELKYDTMIPENVKIKESPAKRLPINLYNTKNNGYESYVKWYQELKDLEVI